MLSEPESAAMRRSLEIFKRAVSVQDCYGKDESEGEKQCFIQRFWKLMGD